MDDARLVPTCDDGTEDARLLCRDLAHRHTPKLACVPPATVDIVGGIVEKTRPGSIILLHPWFGRDASREAIGQVIDRLHADGYRFVTVTELIERYRN
ncbi:MAG TPA: hypothetical protein PK781_11505 [Terrimesophilobacter sp.]|nr:hypothetical protein [Terrimesophilobacter sp.]HRQ01061.1 hypothetical protein [Terrimesophilobacter sp.]